ncbi:hypothetical protein WSK_0344 [Novosphingobium sp. Rr 2-17]|uniref:DUF4169 family protein n=1 Tax=Novosphingobium sp. Rr 2-17 TaxID=555793 RepID=UPI0002698E7C|nr:DUF4169 family protein [Novosphingobium sp. Rr 2-17]EIZ80952.1 hypothetical protein WSK_0344 [Novosphingobium sp. Rr 2-17]
MAEIVNLRKVRKDRARAADQAQAQANRAQFGRTKAEKSLTEAEAARITRTVDGAKLTPAPD